MVTILRNEDDSGKEIGRGLGAALGSSLGALAHHKIGNLQDKHLEQRLVKDGIQPKLASLLVSIGPKAREQYFKEQFDFHKFQNQPQQQPQQSQRPLVQPQQPMQPAPQQNVPRDLQMANKPNTQDILRSLAGQGPQQQPFGSMQPQQQQQPQPQQQFAPQQAQPQFGQQSPNQQFGQAAAEQQVAQQLQQQQQPNNFSNPREDNSLQAKEEIDAQTRRKILAEKYAESELVKGEDDIRKLDILGKMKDLIPKLSGQRKSNIARLTGNTIVTATPETYAFDKFAADLLPMGLTEEQLKSERLKLPSSGLPAKSNQRLIKELEGKYAQGATRGEITQSIIDANGGKVPEDFRKQLHYAIKEQSTSEVKKKELPKNEYIQELEDNDIDDNIEENFLSSGLRNIIGAGANAVSSLANISTLPETLLKHAEQTRNNAIEHALKPGNEGNLYGSDKEKTRKELDKLKDNPIKGIITPIVEGAHDIAKSAFPEGYLQPKTENEKTFQDYAAMIPLYILGGGQKTFKDVAGFLARTAVGKNIGEAVKESGGGEVGKIISQLVIPPLLSTMNPYRVAREFKKIQDQGYKDLPGLAGNKKIDATPLKEALDEAWEEARHGTNISRHRKNIEEWEKYIHNGKFELKNLQPLAKKMNKLAYSKQQTNESYIPIAKALKKMGEGTLHTVPEYGKALLRSNGIYSIYANAEDMKGFLTETLSSVPVTKKSLVKKGIGVIMHNPAIENSKIILKLANRYPKETAEYALNAFKAASKHQTHVFLSEVKKLGRLVEEVDKE